VAFIPLSCVSVTWFSTSWYGSNKLLRGIDPDCLLSIISTAVAAATSSIV